MPEADEKSLQSTPSDRPSGGPASTAESRIAESRIAELGIYDLDPEIKNCLNGIGGALDGAIRLAHPYAEYEEDGTPRFSDAEVETTCGAAEKHLKTVEEAIVHTRKTLVLTALQNYKDYLNYDAIIGFESNGVDEMERSVDYEGRFEGSFEAAAKVVPTLEKSHIRELGQDMLLEDLRHDIALFRARASQTPPVPGPASGLNGEEYETITEIAAARSTLLEKEDALDAILYRAHTGDHNPTNSTERGWRIVARTPAGDHVLGETHTKEVAAYRKQDFETGALVYPGPGETVGKDLVVEEIR